MSLTLRKGNTADLPFLIAGLEENRRGEGRAPEAIAAIPEDHAAFEQGIRQGWVLMAESQGEPLGFLFFRTDFPILYFKGPIFWIDLVFVAQQARGRGVGKALYEEASSMASQLGFDRIVLDVFDANEGSLQFHEKMGFHRVYGIFEKRLAPPRAENR